MKGKYSKVVMIVDNETGEILSDEDKGYVIPMSEKFKEKQRFTKTFHIDEVEFDKKTYYKYFYHCTCNLEMGTNRIVEFTHGGKARRAMTIKDLAKKYGDSERVVREFIRYSTNKKIIRRLDLDGEFFGYFVNPIYVFNGSCINPILYLMFKGYRVDEFIKKSGVYRLDEYLTSFNKEDVVDHIFSRRNTKKDLE